MQTKFERGRVRQLFVRVNSCSQLKKRRLQGFVLRPQHRCQAKLHYARCLANSCSQSAAIFLQLALPPQEAGNARERHVPLRLAGVYPCICMRKLFPQRHLEPTTPTTKNKERRKTFYRAARWRTFFPHSRSGTSKALPRVSRRIVTGPADLRVKACCHMAFPLFVAAGWKTPQNTFRRSEERAAKRVGLSTVSEARLCTRPSLVSPEPF